LSIKLTNEMTYYNMILNQKDNGLVKCHR